MTDAIEMLSRNPVDARKDARKSAAPSIDEAEIRRKKFIEGIDITLGQIKAGEEQPKRGWYQVTAGGVNLKPKVARLVMRIHASGEGTDKFDFIPSDKPLDAAKAFFTDLKSKAKAKQIDSWIAATADGQNVPKGKGGKVVLDDE